MGTPLNDALKRHFRRLRKHLSWMVVAVAGQWCCQRLLPGGPLDKTTDVAGNSTDPLESRLHDGAIELFHELNEAREHRRTIAALHLPDGLRWFVFIGGAITVGALWLVRIEYEALQAIFTAGMTWVVVAISSIVIVLDNPYEGDFVVTWQRFGEAGALMRSIMNRRGASDLRARL